MRTSDYSDAPQKRDRIYIVGKRDAGALWHFDWPKKNPTTKRVKDIAHEPRGEKVSKHYFISEKAIKARIKRKINWQKKYDPKNVGRVDNRGHVMQLLGENDLVPTITYKSGDNIAISTLKQVCDLSGKNQQGYRVYDMDGLGVSINSRGGGWGANTGLFLLNPDDLSKTIRMGGNGSLSKKHNWQVYKMLSGARRLTPRECFRIQGFPDSFTIPKVDLHAYMQIGNAVSVPVITAIARGML